MVNMQTNYFTEGTPTFRSLHILSLSAYKIEQYYTAKENKLQ